MGGGVSTPQPLHKLGVASVKDLVEGLGPTFSDLANKLHENGIDGDYLASASDADLAEICDELAIPKLKQKKTS